MTRNRRTVKREAMMTGENNDGRENNDGKVGTVKGREADERTENNEGEQNDDSYANNKPTEKNPMNHTSASPCSVLTTSQQIGA